MIFIRGVVCMYVIGGRGPHKITKKSVIKHLEERETTTTGQIIMGIILGLKIKP